MNTAFLCLVHPLIIAMAQVNCDPKYKSYGNGRYLKKLVEDLSNVSGVDLSKGGAFKEFQQFQEYLSIYKIIVCGGLSPVRLNFSENSISAKKQYLLYYEDFRH